MRHRYKFPTVSDAEWFIDDVKKLFKLLNCREYLINAACWENTNPTLVMIDHDYDRAWGAIEMIAGQWACEYIRPNRFFD